MEKMKKHGLRAVNIIVLFLSLVIIVSAGVPAYAANGFSYQHDPRQNPGAMADIIEDEDAIYGFRPSETGSLKAYASADWTDPEVVQKGREDRIAYHKSIEAMYEILEEMLEDGKDIEEIARTISTKRNEIRLAFYDGDPEGLAAVKSRNLEQYGHEEGPLPDELYEKYGSWETVLAKAFSANSGMDACLGLYDDYYYLYIAIAQIPDDSPSQGASDVTPPQTGDGHDLMIYTVLSCAGACGIILTVSSCKKRRTYGKCKSL